jgi:hypothetical protein
MLKHVVHTVTMGFTVNFKFIMQSITQALQSYSNVMKKTISLQNKFQNVLMSHQKIPNENQPKS